MDQESGDMKQSFVELNSRQTTQIEELEQLKGKLNQLSQRSRNLSSDRQNPFGFQDHRKSVRQIDVPKQSQSVEKFLNLKQQNQNVDNLIATWKQQKQSISLNSSGINNSIPQIIQTPEYEAPHKTPQIVVEEDEQFYIDEENMIKSQQVKPTQQSFSNNVKVPSRFPNTTRTKPESIQKQKDKSNSGVQQPRKPTITNRPQTTKAQQPAPAVKKQIQPVKSMTNHMKTSFVDTNANSNSNANTNTNEKDNSILSQGPKSTAQFQPTKKTSGSSLLEKQRNSKMVQSKPLMKKQSLMLDNSEEKLTIIQLQKMKDSVLKLYENRQMMHSQNLITKNFDQIINTLKLDFKCLENDD